MSDLTIVSALLLFMCTLSVVFAQAKNYETVTIEECVPGKYFWRESHPQEFYACLTLSKKAVKMRCLAGKYMCNSGPKVFQPCMCKEQPDRRENGISNDPMLHQNALKDGGFTEMKDGRFSQFAKMAPGDGEDVVIDQMRRSVDAAMMSTPAPMSPGDTRDDPSLASGGCPDLYKKSEDTHMLGGMREVNYTQLIDCQQACLDDSTCIGIDWNKETNRDDTDRCYFISPELAAGYKNKMRSTCCDHYRRTMCTDDSTHYHDSDDSYYNNAYVRVGTGGKPGYGMMEKTLPTQPRAITTTANPVTEAPTVSTTTIPDSGCPYTFEEYPGISHPFGQNVTDDPSLAEVEGCKYWCLVRGFCEGVDFDANTNTCYMLVQVAAPLVTRGVSGVTHYRKVDCTRPLRCFSYSSEVHSRLDMAITDPNTPQSSCNGVCFTRETISKTTNMIDRGCMASSVPVRLGCQLSEDYMTITCFCDTMRCNALSVVALASLLLHLPLDDDMSDHSGINHSTMTPDNYSPPDFQCLDKAINCSALFTGNQCIKVTSLTNTQFGVFQPDFRFSPEATFSVYFKRITTSGPQEEGGIFGNSEDPNMLPTWQIISKKYDNYTASGLTSEGSQLASLLDYDYVRADNDKWHLMVMTYEGLFDYSRKLFPKLSLYMDGKAVDGNSMLEEGNIGIRSSPVTIGCVAGANFFGYIDDARVFVTALSREDIAALHVMRDENFFY